METAQHFGSKIWKKLTALLATMALMAVLLPGALAVDLNVDVGFYFKQSRGGTCTLTSAAMMLRRRAYMDGMDSWVDVTENGIKSTAWSGGLSHSFTYNDMHVGYATLPSGKAAKTQALISILAEHPEGIVLYDRTKPHAVLLTDYTNGIFYCSDPAGNISAGRIPLTWSRRPVLARQVYTLDSRMTNRKPFIPNRGSNTATPTMRSTASHRLYRNTAFCSPIPFMAPSTMLSRYISGMAGPSTVR